MDYRRYLERAIDIFNEKLDAGFSIENILLDFFSEDDPYTLSEYTQKIGGI